MTEKKTRSPRRPQMHGLIAACNIFVPVDKKNLRAQLEVEEAFIKATETGDLSDVLKLPGLRITRSDRPHRFGSVPQTGAAPAGEVEDAGEETEETETEETETETEETETEEPAGRGRGRRAA